ncbi:hypothetical protein SDC9_24552 [bioreactor metagenome]
MEGESLAERTYNQVAFKIDDGEFDIHEARIRASELEIMNSRPRVKGEGRSIYFMITTVIYLNYTPAHLRIDWLDTAL